MPWERANSTFLRSFAISKNANRQSYTRLVGYERFPINCDHFLGALSIMRLCEDLMRLGSVFLRLRGSYLLHVYSGKAGKFSPINPSPLGHRKKLGTLSRRYLKWYCWPMAFPKKLADVLFKSWVKIVSTSPIVSQEKFQKNIRLHRCVAHKILQKCAKNELSSSNRTRVLGIILKRHVICLMEFYIQIWLFSAHFLQNVESGCYLILYKWTIFNKQTYNCAHNSFGRSHYRSIGKSRYWSIGRSCYQSIGRSRYQSIGRSRYRSIDRSHYRSIDRHCYQSISRSCYQSIGRSRYGLLVEGCIASSTHPSLNMRYDVKTVFRPIILHPYTLFNFLYISAGFFFHKK